jgi:signal transduction histidine kinase/CheY-like chemotaxis protein
MDSMIDQRYRRFLIVFFAYFLTALGSEYLFHNFNTSPAIIWPPVGIAFGFMFVWGYEEWIPIAVAQFLASLLNPSNPIVLSVFASTFAYTAEALFGVYVLKKFKFDGALIRTRDVVIFLLSAILLTAIGPGIITIVAHLDHTLTVDFWINWSRSWAGGILSIIILMPFITSWLSSERQGLKDLKSIESSSAMILVAFSTYVLFWTTLASSNSFFLIYVFFGVFFWIGLRLQPRVMTLGLLLATVLGITGSILKHPTAVSLSTQLFGDELFMILIAPIFLILSVVATERRVAVNNFAKETHELALTMQKLSDADASKNEFISMLAHELRNPLAPIASTLEYLRLNEKDPQHLKEVVMAEQQVRIVRRLLDDLLDVARITQKKFRVQRETVTLDEILQPAIAAVKPFYKSKGQHFSVSLLTEKILLRADPARMTQAIMNLLFNAGKYTPPSGEIDLSVEHQGSTVLINIKDNGIGISAEALPSVFEPFHQASREAEMGTGLGLGLFITKQLIDMHEGLITATSEGINQGATLSVRLPVLPGTMPESVTVLRDLPARRKAEPHSRIFNILLVDDNEAAAHALEKLLTFRGHTVHVVYDGQSVPEAIAAYKPKVVILDIGLPDINGYEVARKIRSSGINQPVLIALTGYGQEEDLTKAQNAGFDHHLTKPVGLADIEKALNYFV